MLVLKKRNKASELPPDWDDLAVSYFQKKAFLEHCERFNPCQQRYYLLFDNNNWIAGAVVYTLVIDLFTFSQIKSPISMQVIGIPVSVAASGIVGTLTGKEQLLQAILKEEKGLIAGLNLNPQINTEPGVSMPILPNVEMLLMAKSWEDYIHSLRSAYRRRLYRITEHFKEIKTKKTDCQYFNADHYRLYLEIMKRTPNKLEILSKSFFQNLLSPFQLTTYYKENQMLCWHITCQDDRRFYFFFGGHDYQLMEKYDSYFNNLFGVLKGAIAQNCNYLDLGQTAEIPKMRIGGQLMPKQLFLYHRNGMVRWLIKKLRYFIGYQGVFPAVRVFKTKNAITKLSNGLGEQRI